MHLEYENIIWLSWKYIFRNVWLSQQKVPDPCWKIYCSACMWYWSLAADVYLQKQLKKENNAFFLWTESHVEGKELELRDRNNNRCHTTLYEAKSSAFTYLPCYLSSHPPTLLSSFHLRMNYPMQTTKAPLQELLTQNPAVLCPVSPLLLKLMRTVMAPFPTRHRLPMMELVQRLLNLPLPCPCLLLLVTSWRRMTHPHRTRKLQMDSRRT